MKTPCPVCLHHTIVVSEIDNMKAIEGCKVHGKWFVTVCSKCHRTVLSDCVNACRECFPLLPYNFTGKVDHRASLRADGQESVVDYFGTHDEYE